MFTESPAALIILLATVGISLYAIYKDRNIYERFLLSPWRVANQNQFHLMVTSGFLHADVAHLMFNMFTFLFFAFKLEYYSGTLNFILIYFLSMIIADVTTVIKHKDDPYYRAVGASGAISGVLFSYILFDPTTKIGFILFPIGIPAPIFAVLYLVYCWFAAKKSRDFINHEAHLWGALGGIIVTAILVPEIIPHFFEMIFG